MSELNEHIKELGQDLHNLGVCNSTEIPAKLYEMGWRKTPIIPATSVKIAPNHIQEYIASPLSQAVNPTMIPRTQKWVRW